MKTRIREEIDTEGVSRFYVQQRIFFFWVAVTDYYGRRVSFCNLSDARDFAKKSPCRKVVKIHSTEKEGPESEKSPQ